MKNSEIEYLDSIYIEKLKNINKLELNFNRDKNITAIFGPNGCGKSTILHALACVYQRIRPDNPKTPIKGEEYRFSDFFIPTNYGAWEGSELEITYNTPQKKKRYVKKKDRWSRYEDRPRREVYFIGIDICVPKIEKEKKKSKINIKKESDIKEKKIKDISFVMNRKYEQLSDCNEKKYKLATSNNISYPSLFMGAGENKIIEIINLLHDVSDNALILIDELDLTIHTIALKRLLDVMIRISKDKKLQIVFTSHREEILEYKEVKENIEIRHIINFNENKTECIDRTTSKCIEQLTGIIPNIKTIYVEDNISEAIVKRFLKENEISRYYNIIKFGAIDNAFTIACGLYLSHKEIFQKSFFILDGDKYVEESEKLKWIEKRYSGTECGAENNRKEILTRFFQYSSKIKDGKFISPEEFIYDVIIQSENEKMKNTETYDALKNVQGVNDSHQYFPVSYQVDFIIEDFSKYLNSEWLEYTKELKGILSLNSSHL